MTAPQPDARHPALTVLNTHLQGCRCPLRQASVTLGRSPECEFILDQGSVSRQHARVEEVGQRYFVQDLGSRNGVKIGTERVTRAEIRFGDVFTIGEIQIRLDPPDTAPPPTTAPAVPRPLTGADIIAAAQSAQVPGLAVQLEPPGGPSEPKPQIGLNLKLLAAVLLTFIISIVVGLLIVRQSAAPSPDTARKVNLLIKVGENKWLSIRAHGDFSDVNVAIDDDVVADARKFGRGQLVITGKSGGATDITVVTDKGITVPIRVLVRGRISDSLEDLTYADFTSAERRHKGRVFVERGLVVQDKHPYLAYQQYRRAVAVLKPLPDKGKLYVQAKRLSDAIEAEVEACWKKLDGDIAVALRTGNYARALELLDDAMQLIPDPNDPRHQKAQRRWQRLTSRGMQRRKRSRRRRP